MSDKLIDLYRQLAESEAPKSSGIQGIDFNDLPKGSSEAPPEPSLFERISAQTRKQQELGNVGAPEPALPAPKPTASVPAAPQESVVEQKPLSAPLFQATLDPYGAELNDEALKQAYADKRQGDLTAAMLKAGSMIGSGISGAVSKGKRPSSDIDTSSIEKLAGGKLEEIQGRRAGKKDEVSFDKARTELGDTKALSDPNSSISKLTGEMLRKLGMKIPEGVSAAQLKASGIDVDRMMNAKELSAQRAAAAQEARENRRFEKEKLYYQKNLDRIKSFGEKATGSPEVKKAEEQLAAANGIKLLVDEAAKKGGQAVAALGPQLAKAMGEVGALTESDVTRYVKNPQIAAGIMQTMDKSLKGKLSPQDAENITRLVGILGKKAEDSRAKAYDLKVKQAQNTLKNEGIEPSFIKEAIDPFGYSGSNQSLQPQPASDTVKVRAPNGQVKLVPRSKLDAALKAGGQLAE